MHAQPRSRAGPDVAAFLDAVPDVREYSTVAVSGNGQVTVPKTARSELGLVESQHFYIYGSPTLGLAFLVGQRKSPRELLGLMLEGESPAASST
jgi:hypothetical protein